MSDDQKKGILLEVGTNEVEFLVFCLGTQLYGINVGKVRQITVYDAAKVSRVPKQLPEIVGLMTFREQSISIVDLRTHLNVPPISAESHRPLLLVTEFNQRTTGFVIDAVERIERCSWSQFEPISNTSCASNGSVVGTVTLKEGIVIILDLESIMSSIDPSMGLDHFENQIQPQNSVDRAHISIVHCDDSAIIQKVLVRTLEAAGFAKIKTFTTGQECLDYLNTADAKDTDIILSDIEMPKMDGLTLCKQLKTLSQYNHTPFVFFSSMISEEMAKKCEAVGADAYFSKPEIHLIVDAIETLVKSNA